MSLENKIITELPNAFILSKEWCRNNLHKEIIGYQSFELNKFHYIIDNTTDSIADMYFNLKENGLIRVNTGQIKWLIERQEAFPYNPEVDLESMFVHEMTEYIAETTPEIIIAYFPLFKFPHMLARDVENINRKQRNLKEWTY